MMNVGPTELRLTLAPQRRFEAIDVNTRIAREAGDVLAAASAGALLFVPHDGGLSRAEPLGRGFSSSQDQLSQFFRHVPRALSRMARSTTTIGWICARN